MSRIAETRRRDRRAEILEAAERCFVRSGFHGASMAEVCAEAGMSAGNLYRYFPSKEAMIEGLCERDFEEIGAEFAALAAAPDIWQAFRDLAQRHMVEEPREHCVLWIESMSEVARNPQIAALRLRIDTFIHDKLLGALTLAKARGQTAPQADLPRAVQFLITFADGLMLRRARDPDFDPAPLVVIMFDVMRDMLLPSPAPAPAS